MLIFLGFIVLAILVRLAAGGLDRDRVGDYIRSRGGRLLSSEWTPFGPGWAGEKSDRIYKIRFLDAQGNEHDATCKTSLLTGVYLTEDQIVRHAAPRGLAPGEAARSGLEDENRRLREEIERLKRRDA